MSSPATRRRKWRRWIEPITTSVTGLVLNRLAFLELSGAIEKEGLGGQELHQWLAATHGYEIAMALRRLLDGNPRTYSLIVLLREMRDSNQSLTRRSYVRRYNRGGAAALPAGTADRVFDDMAGAAQAFIPRSVIQRDLRSLQAASRRIKPIADKMIAHRDRRRGRLGARTIKDLHDAVSLVEKMCIRYRLILVQLEPDTLLPSVTANRLRSNVYRLTHPTRTPATRQP